MKWTWLCCWIAMVLAVAPCAANDGPDLAARLGSPDRSVARAALDEAVGMGRSALPLLRETLLGEDPLARQYAAVALGRINAPGADRALVSCLRAWDDPYLQQYAGEALAARGDAALPLLDGLLDANDLAARSEGHEPYYHMGDWMSALPRPLLNRLLFKQAARPHTDLTGAPGPFFLELGEAGMRRWAGRFSADVPFPSNQDASRLWRASTNEYGGDGLDGLPERWDLFGTMSPNSYEIELHERAEDYLPDLCWELLDAPDPRQRYWACSHLLRLIPPTRRDQPIGDRVKLLRAMLTDEHFMVTSLLFRDRYLDLDGQSEMFHDELRQCLQHEAEPVRVMAAAALIKMGDAEGVDFAARALPDACEETAGVLLYAFYWDSEATSDEQKMTLLGPMISWMRRHKVGGRVVGALGDMPPQAVPAITEMLDDPELEVRRDTALILGKIGDPSAVPTLEKLLDHLDGRMRINALGALGKILRADVAPYLDSFLDSDDPADQEAAFWAAYNAEDVELMAQVVRRAPEGLDMSLWGIMSSRWLPNMAPAVRTVTLEERLTSDALPYKRPQLPSPVLEAARAVLAYPGATLRGRWNAASLIVWNWSKANPTTWGEDDRQVVPEGLPDEVWSALCLILDNRDLVPKYRGSETSHIEAALGSVRRREAVPQLARWARGYWGYRPIGDALAHIEPEGVQVLLDDLRSEEDDMARAAANALLRVGVEAALEPIMDLYRSGRLRLSHDSLRQMDEAKTKQAALDAIVADPLKVTRDDLRTIGWADEARGLALAREVLGVRRGYSPRSVAISMLARTDSPEDLALLRSVARDELELSWLRYRALRGIERQRPEEAREIARRWTRDHRYGVRHLGRQVLRGEEQHYL